MKTYRCGTRRENAGVVCADETDHGVDVNPSRQTPPAAPLHSISPSYKSISGGLIAHISNLP